MTLPTPDAPAPKQRKVLSALASVISIFIITAAVTPFLCIGALVSPGPLAEGKTVIIAHGSTAAEIGKQLASEKTIYASLLFHLAARLTGPMKAGEYALPARASIMDIAKMMHEGRSVVRLFTVAEGLSSGEIVHLLNDDLALAGVIGPMPQEGSLLPESYRYSYGDSRAGIIARMQKAMAEKLNAIWEGRDADLPLGSPKEALVLASIVEKETGKAEERPRVAGVFYNRLRKNMRLQSDPTVIYAMTKGQKALERALTHEDLSYPSPINTYMSDGLPPQPICNPGVAALEAAVHPEHHGFLYFVANGTDGGHSFAANLPAHNENINRWHKAIDKKAPRK